MIIIIIIITLYILFGVLELPRHMGSSAAVYLDTRRLSKIQ